MRLTARRLRALGACLSERQLFDEVFPKGAPLTKASIRKARKANMNLAWLKEKVTPDTGMLCPRGACDICDRRRVKQKRVGKLAKRLRKLLRYVRLS